MTRRCSAPRSRLHSPTGASQRGTTLIESMVGFTLLALGMLGLAQMSVFVTGGASSSQQRNEAVHLAQDQLECLRDWPSRCAASYAAIASGSDPDPIARGGAVFHRSWTVTNDDSQPPNPVYKVVTVTVQWENKEGADASQGRRTVVLASKISDVPPVVTLP